MTHAAVAHLGDMEQSRLFQPNVNECAEIRNIAYGTLEDGTNGEV